MKKWYTSKTIWLAVLTGVAGILQVLNANYELASIAMLYAVAQTILRFLTTEPIK